MKTTWEECKVGDPVVSPAVWCLQERAAMASKIEAQAVAPRRMERICETRGKISKKKECLRWDSGSDVLDYGNGLCWRRNGAGSRDVPGILGLAEMEVETERHQNFGHQPTVRTMRGTGHAAVPTPSPGG
jgi:hypothetical protein